MPLERKDVDSNRKWDLSVILNSDTDFDKEEKEVREKLSEIIKYSKILNLDNAHECLKLESEISRKAERIFIYANLKKDEDTSNAKYQAMSDKADMLMVDISSALSFISPRLVKYSKAQLEEASKRPEYSNFTVLLRELIRQKKHILSEKEEKLLSEISAFTGDFRTIFSMFNDADIKFDDILDEKGNKIEMSHGAYSVMLQHPNQEVRERAFKAYYKSFIDMTNTVAATYSGSVKKDVATAKVRGYKSAIQKALFNEEVPEKVYNNLLKAVKKATPSVHKYAYLRKKALKLKELHMYDMYTPITKEAKLSLDYDEAYKLVIEALKPLGEEYSNILKEAFSGGWIDVEETKNKRSGAYSWGSYDCHPFVLLNYQPTTHDIFTIAHEMGHAIHSYMSNRTQCYEKANYVIFVAEIASTVNEVLLLKHLLKTAEGENRKFLLAYYLDMFRTTLFRQTMFAEFEKFSHEEVERGVPLTAESMNAKYLELNKKYYGKGVIHDDEIKTEWMRIPHFYRSFYVYKYATGLTSAVNIASKILEDSAFCEKYFKFLSAGGSMPPLDILALAEVDLTTTAPFDFAMKEFKETLEELTTLV